MRSTPRNSTEVGGPKVEPAKDEHRSSQLLPIPTWALVGGLFALSTLVRLLLALRDPAPWIFNDEIQYSELAKSLAYSGGFAIREVEGTGGFPILYPILIAPAFALFESVPTAYAGVKVVNCLLVSAAVFPVYFLARRVASRGWAIAAAAFSVSVPTLMLTGTMMSENAFFPLVTLWLLVTVRALERPTVSRQLLVFVLIGLAFLARPQGVVLIPTLVGAIGIVILLDAWAERRWPDPRLFWHGIRSYWATWLLLLLGAVAAVVRQELRGQPLREFLGSYAGVTHLGYEWNEFGTWALYHLAEAEIFVGVFPFAAFLAVVIRGLAPSAERDLRVFAALALTTVGVFLAVVAAYASSPTGDRILERNFFHVTPLFFIALAAWATNASVRRWWTIAPAALFAGTLTLALPINNFLNGTIVHSTPGLLPIWRWRDRLFSPESIDEWVAAAAIVAALSFAAVPRRFSPLIAVALALYLAAASRPVESYTHDTSRGTFISALGSPKDWVDNQVGADADVAMVWAGGADAFPFWETEVFNRSVGRAYTLLGAWDGLVHAINHVTVRPDGRIVQPSGEAVRPAYAVTDTGTTFRGDRVASNGADRMALYRVEGPLVLEERFEGLYPDKWSAETFSYRRYACRPGTLRLGLESSNALHPRPFSVTVRQHGRQTGRLRFSPRQQFPEAAVRLEPRAGLCDVVLQIPTGSAERSTPGDPRQLGLRFLNVRYEPSR